MGYRVDPLRTFGILHDGLPYSNEIQGYKVRITQADVGKMFTVKRRFNADHDGDVGAVYKVFDCNLTGTLFAGSHLEVVSCTKDKHPNAIEDPNIGADELQVVGSWSLPDGVESEPKRQQFKALELGTKNGKLFVLALGIRVVACGGASRVKLKLLKYTVE